MEFIYDRRTIFSITREIDGGTEINQQAESSPEASAKMSPRYFSDRRWSGLAFIILSVLALSASVAAEDDATLLQQRAIARIEAFIDHFRKTSDFQSRAADLQQAESELIASQQAFAARGDWSAVAHSLMRLGQIQRMQADWESALAYYREAVTTAERANDTAIQARALIGFAQTETQQRDYGSAAVHAAQAITLSEPLADRKLSFDALSIAGQIQIGQGNFNAAVDTLNRAFIAAQESNDEPSLFYSYLDRADVYFKFARECDYQRT